MERTCWSCGAALGVDDEVCPACGARNKVQHPWYIWPIGFLIVAVLVFLLVDIEVWQRYLAGFTDG